MITRRELIIAFGACTVAVPLHSFAQQQGKVWRIGLPFTGSRTTSEFLVESLKQGMREQGYVDTAVVYNVAYAEGRMERLPNLLQEMVARKPDVLVTAGPVMTRATLDTTRSIPVVMANVSNVVGNKFVQVFRVRAAMSPALRRSMRSCCQRSFLSCTS